MEQAILYAALAYFGFQYLEKKQNKPKCNCSSKPNLLDATLNTNGNEIAVLIPGIGGS